MFTVPADNAVTIPELPALATLAFELLQIPEIDGSVRFSVVPAHIVVVPLIIPAAGKGLTVTNIVSTAVPQLLFTAYDIIVVPAETPVTIPVLLTSAMAAFSLLHIPPDAVSLNVVVVLSHTADLPEIVSATGNGLINMGKFAAAVPQEFVTI